MLRSRDVSVESGCEGSECRYFSRRFTAAEIEFKIRAFSAPTALWGTTLYTLEQATNRVLTHLYRGFSLPQAPVSSLKRERNAAIRAQYAAGTSVPDLARRYGISEQRVHQMLRGRRK